MKKAVLIDGNSLINRAFYALPSLTDKSGNETNAIYGFSNILFKLLNEISPDYMAVAFDLKAPTFRHKMYDGYKSSRKGMPPELASQMEPIKKMLELWGIQRIELSGYEADDIIGTVSKYLEEQNISTLIITGDRDSFQLASDTVKIMFTKKGISEFDIIDKNEMIKRYSLTPTQFIDLKGLMGDKSDDIPGVVGIGEKTGIKLLEEYGSIDNIYKNIDSIKGANQKRLKENKDIAYMSKKLATIVRDIPVELNLEDVTIKDIDKEGLKNFFAQRSMMTSIRKLEQFLGEGKKEEIKINREDISEDIEKLLKNAKDKIYIKILKEEDIVTDKSILSLIILSQGKLYSIKENQLPEIKNLLEDSNIYKCGYDIKAEYLALLPYGIKLSPLHYDLKIADYVLDPENSNHDIKDISIKYGLGNIKSNEEFFGKGKGRMVINNLSKGQIEPYYAQILKIVEKSEEKILSLIESQGMDFLFSKVEMPLVQVLADMEYCGIEVDEDYLKIEQKEFEKIIISLEQDIYSDAGEEFNINSPKQLGVILFEKLGLPVVKKTKTGYSTSADVLDKLLDKHPIISRILDYRTYAKLQSTYVEGLLNIINPDTGRIHSSFNQTITATGRISSTEPNLQNIPVRTKIGRNLRKAFVSKKGYVLVDSDYSQIELRVLAHISDDDNLIAAFAKSRDIHTLTASEVFGVDVDDVTPEMRSAAKAVNFGIVYGISDFGLSNNLSITKKQAKEYIDLYLSRYPNVQNYMEKIVEKGEKDGYVSTILERRRYIPQLKSRNFVIKNLGKRLAMNTPIQGSAADIIKMAMVKVYQRLSKEDTGAKLILQVHDELIIECKEEEKARVAKMLKEEMEDVIKLKVNLVADVSIGKSWYDTK